MRISAGVFEVRTRQPRVHALGELRVDPAGQGA